MRLNYWPRGSSWPFGCIVLTFNFTQSHCPEHPRLCSSKDKDSAQTGVQANARLVLEPDSPCQYIISVCLADGIPTLSPLPRNLEHSPFVELYQRGGTPAEDFYSSSPGASCVLLVDVTLIVLLISQQYCLQERNGGLTLDSREFST